MTRYRWVAARKAEGFPTTPACAVARVPRQGSMPGVAAVWRGRPLRSPPRPNWCARSRAFTPAPTAPTGHQGSPASCAAGAAG